MTNAIEPESRGLTETQFRDALESSPIGATIVRPDGSFSFVNARMTEILGVSKEQFFASRPRQFWADPGQLDLINERLSQHGRLRDFEARLRNSDGTPVWVLLSFEPAPFDGEPCYFGWVYDISELKRAQEAAAEQSQIVRNTLDTMDQGIIMVDENMDTVTCNHQFANMFSLTEELLHEQPSFHDLIRDWFRRSGLDEALLEKAIKNTYERGPMSFEQPQPDGRTLEIHHLPRDDGWFVRTFTDISDRKRTEARLSRQALEAELLHRAADMAAETASIAEALRLTLDMICEMTDWAVGHVYQPMESDHDRLVSTTIWHFDEPEKYTTFRDITERTDFSVGQGLPGRILESGEPAWIANVQVDANFPRAKLATDLGVKGAFGFPVKIRGRAVAVLEFFSAEVMEPDPTLLEIMENVGEQLGRVFERKEAETDLRAAKEGAEQALSDLTRAQQELVRTEKMASLGALTAGIAHEIKNPLNFVNNFAETSVELLDELEEALVPGRETMGADTRGEVDDLLRTLRSDLQTIATHGHRADDIMRSMLMHARDHTSALEPTDLNALVGKSLKLSYHGERARNTQFTVKTQTELDDTIGMAEVAPQDLTRVLVNLFGNAFYATRKRQETAGNGDYQPAVKVTTKGLGDQVEVRIWDNGTGMPPEVVEKLFNPFFTTKPAGEGTGLGLSLSYDIIVQGHGGSMSVDSKAGEFSEFVLRLPHAVKEGGSA